MTGDSGVRADPPGNTIDAGDAPPADATILRAISDPGSITERLLEPAHARYESLPHWQARAVELAAAPVIAAQARAEADALIAQAEDHARQEEERFDSVMADFVADLPPCPNCGCRTSDEADCRDCGCDTGCNDGDWHPGVNVIAAQAARDARQRLLPLLFALHKLYDVVWNQVATLDGDIPGYNLISYDDDNAVEAAARPVEELLASGEFADLLRGAESDSAASDSPEPTTTPTE